MTHPFKIKNCTAIVSEVMTLDAG